MSPRPTTEGTGGVAGGGIPVELQMPMEAHHNNGGGGPPYTMHAGSVPPRTMYAAGPPHHHHHAYHTGGYAPPGGQQPPQAHQMLSAPPTPHQQHQAVPQQQQQQASPRGPYYAAPTPAELQQPHMSSMDHRSASPQPSSPSKQQQQQQQPQQILSPETPWTLGSTDGSYAMNLVVMEHKLLGDASSSPDGAGSDGGKKNNNNSDSAAATTASNGTTNSGGGATITNSGEANVRKQQQKQQQKQAAADRDNVNVQLIALQNKRSLYQDRLFKQPSSAVEATLAAACEVMSFDIAEMWLRTGLKTHQLTNSHLRPTALDESTRIDLVDVYYGERSSERTHRLSPALCKRAKEANDVVWVTAHTKHGAEALRCSISNVRTAVAVPVCHEASNTNITIIFFCIRRVVVRPTSVEFLVHMALAAGVASVNSLAEAGHLDRDTKSKGNRTGSGAQGATGAGTAGGGTVGGGGYDEAKAPPPSSLSRSEHVDTPSIAIRHQRTEHASITGAPLDLQWRQLQNVEYLTDGGNSWIHTAVFQSRPVVVKTLKPECQDVALAINEIEGELDIHARLDHPNIVRLIGAGTTSKSVRFVVLERLDGGTLTQMLGYDTRIRDRRRRFWKKKQFSFVDVLRIARSIAEAMTYLHEEAIPGSIVMHRDLKPDNIGFTLDGTVKVLDFGLAKIVENASVSSKDVYTMSGETGSLRYMAPEVAEGTPYNSAADVYSFGIILWELNAGKKPFDGLNRESFYEQVVHGGERPHIKGKWPEALSSLMTSCWDENMWNRPTFREIVTRLDEMLTKEKGASKGNGKTKKPLSQRLSGMIDRHSTWF